MSKQGQEKFRPKLRRWLEWQRSQF